MREAVQPQIPPSPRVPQQGLPSPWGTGVWSVWPDRLGESGLSHSGSARLSEGQQGPPLAPWRSASVSGGSPSCQAMASGRSISASEVGSGWQGGRGFGGWGLPSPASTFTPPLSFSRFHPEDEEGLLWPRGRLQGGKGTGIMWNIWDRDGRGQCLGHKIIDWFALEGTLNIIQFQSSHHGQGHLPLDCFLGISLLCPSSALLRRADGSLTLCL